MGANQSRYHGRNFCLFDSPPSDLTLDEFIAETRSYRIDYNRTHWTDVWKTFCIDKSFFGRNDYPLFNLFGGIRFDKFSVWNLWFNLIDFSTQTFHPDIEILYDPRTITIFNEMIKNSPLDIRFRVEIETQEDLERWFGCGISISEFVYAIVDMMIHGFWMTNDDSPIASFYNIVAKLPTELRLKTIEQAFGKVNNPRRAFEYVVVKSIYRQVEGKTL